MAKGNMLLGQARGKVGDIVFSRNNGQQVVRARAAVVANPQTEKQLFQRILMNTASQAYSKLKAITDHSFEGKKIGQECMAEFMRRNLNLLRYTLATSYNQRGDLDGTPRCSALGTNNYAFNPYVISAGSLPVISVTPSAQLEDNVSIKVKEDGNTLTYQEFASAFGLQRGDQITFCELFVNAQGVTIFDFARIILDPTSAEGEALPMSTEMIANNAANMPSARNTGSFAVLTVENGAIKFSIGGGISASTCVIVSRQNSDGSWLRSNARLFVPDLYLETSNGGMSMQEALDYFAAGGISTGSEYYLNNAGVGGTTASNSQTPAAAFGVSALTANGESVLAASAAVTADDYEVAITGVASNLSQANMPQVILSNALDKNVGDSMTAGATDVTLDIEENNFSGSVTLNASAYRAYIVSNGKIVAKCGTVTVESEEPPAGGGD